MNSNNAPLVSVVIPVYNVLPYLKECLDSVIGQTYKELEIIVVDDGSTDESGSVCDEYAIADNRIRVIHQKNGGLGNARNTGMDIAVGKYIIFLDSDDYWSDETIESLCLEAETNKLQALAFSAEPFWEGEEAPIKNMPSYQHTVGNGMVTSGAESMKLARENNEYYSQACMRFYEREYIRALGFRFDEGVIHEDESFSFLAYIFAERLECTEKRFYKRRLREGSIMSNRTVERSAKGYIKALDSLITVYNQKELTELQIELFSARISELSHTVFSMYEQLLSEKSKEANIASKAISQAAKPVFSKLRQFSGGYRKKMKLATYDFKLAYWVSSIKEKILSVFTN